MPDTVAALRAAVDAALNPLVAPGQRVALLNFPDHGNPGDPAIWLGTLAWLRRRGARVAYTCSWQSFDPRALRPALGDGVVLLNGGGNFGDLYAGQQGARERALRQLVGLPVIQLPQSVHFRDPANLERMRTLVAAHGDVTLMLREERSLAFAHDSFDTPTVLCPDMVICYEPPSSAPPEVDIVWLARRAGDPEHGGHDEPPADPRIRRVDWLASLPAAERAWPAGRRALLFADRWLGTHHRETMVGAGLGRVQALLFEPLARTWAARGFGILAQGRVVVTDKLHGHLFCVLTGQPHVVMDNSYGKVSATWQTWTHSCPTARWADTTTDARAQAELLLESL